MPTDRTDILIYVGRKAMKIIMEKSKNIHIWLYTILIAGFIAALVWALTLNRSAKALELDKENQYNRAFHEMVGYISDMDTLLSKAQLASSPAEMATLASDIFRQSAEAKSCLGQLPTSEIQLENTSKFLSQAGDYTYVLSQSMINGEEISQEEYENLSSLNQYATSLKDSLVDIQNQLYSGDIRFSDMSAQRKINSAEAAGNDILVDLENIEKSFEEYPSLIYDGPFSDHIENQQSEMINSQDEISQDEALKKAKEFLGYQGDDLYFSGETQNTAIDAYNFSNNAQHGHVSISITKRGGYVLYFLKNVTVTEENYDISSATENALSFLNERGFSNMVSSYYQTNNGIATINFAYSQDGVVCYSDLIKVRVALDTGNVVGIETNGYLMNHKYRDAIVPKLTLDEAREKISTNLEVSSSDLAVIPKDSMKEVLCYEFKGVFQDKNFIIYINADNGREENILLLLEDENGILTI
jgi:spore germination protein